MSHELNRILVRRLNTARRLSKRASRLNVHHPSLIADIDALETAIALLGR